MGPKVGFICRDEVSSPQLVFYPHRLQHLTSKCLMAKFLKSFLFLSPLWVEGVKFCPLSSGLLVSSYPQVKNLSESSSITLLFQAIFAQKVSFCRILLNPSLIQVG